MSSAAASTEAVFDSLAAVSLKPLLRFIASECVARMSRSPGPPHDSSIVEFVIELLNTNKGHLENECRIGTNRPALPFASETKSSTSAMKEAPAASIASPPCPMHLKCHPPQP